MNRCHLKPMVLTITCFVLLGMIFTRVASAEPLRIGATVSLEGKYKEVSAMIQQGYRLWASQVNKRGGLLGRPVELILYDDKSREDLVGPLYEKLITEDGVDLVLSPYGTPLTLKASEITESHGYVMLACAAAGEEIWERGYHYVFGVYALGDRYFIGFLDLIARNGLSTLGIIFENTSFHISVAEGARKWAERFGLNVVYDEGFNDSLKQLPRMLKQVASKNVDGLIFSGYPPDCYRFIGLMKRADYRPKALALPIVPVHPDFAKRVGPFAEGVFGPSQWEPDERIPFPGTEKFIHDFETFSEKSPSYHAGSAYAACQILEEAVKRTESFDNRKIRDFVSALDTVHVIGRFKVDHTGRQIGHNPILIQWQNKKKEIVYPLKMATAPPKFKFLKESSGLEKQ